MKKNAPTIQQKRSNNKISRRKINTIRKIAPTTAGERILKYLAQQGCPCSTAELAGSCAAGNVSAAVSSLDDLLESLGLEIVHHLPTPLFKNRFGSTSLMHLWQLVEADREA